MVIHDRITHSANSVHYNALFALEHNAASALRTMSLRLHIQACMDYPTDAHPPRIWDAREGTMST